MAADPPVAIVDFLARQDILMLQELGASQALSNLSAFLGDYHWYGTTHDPWRCGKGVALAVRASLAPALVAPPTIDSDLQLIHARFAGLVPGGRALLHVIVMYVPGITSEQLAPDGPDGVAVRAARAEALAARYAALQQRVERITATSRDDLIIVGGDMNAKIGCAPVQGAAAVAALAAAGLSACRQQQLGVADASGGMLNTLCDELDLINITGLLPGDVPAPPTFSAAFRAGPPIGQQDPEPVPLAGSSRVDHFVVSPNVVRHITDLATRPDVRGSDHVPLRLELTLAPPPRPARPPPGQPEYRIIVPTNDPVVQARFLDLMTRQATWEQLAAAPAPTHEDALAALHHVMFTTAVAAGFTTRALRTGDAAARPLPPRTSSNFKAWHDHECKRLQQAIRSIPQPATSPAAAQGRAELLRQYKRRVTRLVRQHKIAAAKEQMRSWRSNPAHFWRSFRRPSDACPLAPSVVARHFEAKLNTSPAPTTVGPAGPPPAARQDATSVCPSVPVIIAALQGLDSTAAGVDGLPVCLFKPSLSSDQHPPLPPRATPANAIAHIAAALHTVFDRISESATVPSSWRTSWLVPTYKHKGDRADAASYRPLAVPTVACRVWSAITNAKLLALTAGQLPDTMFGFRPEMSCSDPLFVLRHLADTRKRRPAGDTVFAAAFMDLSGAYDTVDRELLFCRLERQLGVAAHTLAVLRSLYQDTACVVKCGGGCSLPFSVRCGLRQGCPLSTTLFNLYIWDLHQRLVAACPGVGVRVGPAGTGRQVTDLGYADDIALCSSSPEGLQGLIDCFCAYCAEHGLVVNPSKCAVMVFGAANAWAGRRAWSIPAAEHGDRRPLPVVDEVTYLGLEVHGAARSFRACADHRLGRMKATQAAIRGRLKDLRAPHDPSIVAGLFASITAAAGSYACEIWATSFLHAWHLKSDECALHALQATVYKRCLGLPRAAASLLALFEVGRYPLQVQWLSRTVRYWNKLARLAPGSSLLADVFAANVAGGLEHGWGDTWVHELRAGLQFVCPDVAWTPHMLQGRTIDVRTVVSSAQHAFCRQLLAFTGAPGADDCVHRHFCKYATHMVLGGAGEDHDCLPRPAYIGATAPLARKQALARLRLSCAPVQTNLARGVPYSARLCTRCAVGVPDTEHHFLFDCPALSAVRAPFLNDLPLADRDLAALMSGVYDGGRVHRVLKFVSRMTKAISGPTA